VLRHVICIMVVFTALAVAASLALRHGVDALVDGVARTFGAGRTRIGGCGFPEDSNFDVKTRCTPESWWRGGETVSSTLTVDANHYLKSFLLYSAHDDDDDGFVGPSEWTLLCTGSIEESPGRTVATIRETHVDRSTVAYRLVIDGWRDGIWWTQWGQSDLAYSYPSPP